MPRSSRKELSTDFDAHGCGLGGTHNDGQMAWTYILQCADGSYYVGSARDLDARLAQHSLGKGSTYTSRRLPVSLAWAMEFDRVDEAWEAERRLHGWSRAKKRALIEGRIADLRTLSRNLTEHPR